MHMYLTAMAWVNSGKPAQSLQVCLRFKPLLNGAFGRGTIPEMGRNIGKTTTIVGNCPFLRCCCKKNIEFTAIGFAAQTFLHTVGYSPKVRHGFLAQQSLLYPLRLSDPFSPYPQVGGLSESMSCCQF